jgi:hypothetical protein
LIYPQGIPVFVADGGEKDVDAPRCLTPKTTLVWFAAWLFRCLMHPIYIENRASWNI